MNPHFEVRPASKDEMESILRLFQETLTSLTYYNDLAKKSEFEKYTLSKLLRCVTEDPYSVLVAVDNTDKVIGFCFNRWDSFTVWIDWYGVASSYRDKGVGLQLLEFTAESARRRGAHKVWCDSRTTNEPSNNLLRKAGFKELVEIKNHWFGQDFILWERFV